MAFLQVAMAMLPPGEGLQRNVEHLRISIAKVVFLNTHATMMSLTAARTHEATAQPTAC